jgi:hypothetical protein
VQDSVQEILKASVMAGVDVVSGLLSDLMESAKALSSCLPQVKEQCLKGIPASLRAKAWPLLCGATQLMKDNTSLYQVTQKG